MKTNLGVVLLGVIGAILLVSILFFGIGINNKVQNLLSIKDGQVAQDNGIKSTSSPGVRVEYVAAEKNARPYPHVFNVTYPQFGISAADSRIKEVVDGTIADFELQSPKPEYALRIEPRYVYVGPEVVSVELFTSEYTGGAHPYSEITTFNFDHSGNPVSREDALKMIGLTIEGVSAGAIAQLRAGLGHDPYLEAVVPDSRNFESFVISWNDVVFVFQSSETSSHADGPQRVSFPIQ